MTQDFIDEKQLDFIESPETGDFWGGIDSCRDHTYELFFAAGEDGPTQGQVARYTSLCEKMEGIYSSLREKYQSYVAAMDANQRSRWQNRILKLQIVSVYEDGAENEADICCGVSRGMFIFARTLDFVAGIHHNQVASFKAI